MKINKTLLKNAPEKLPVLINKTNVRIYNVNSMFINIEHGIDLSEPVAIGVTDFKNIGELKSIQVIDSDTVLINGVMKAGRKDVDDFPETPTPAVNDYTFFQITKTELTNVSYCMAKNDVRYYLNGIYIDSGAEKLVATDGHRIVHKKWAFTDAVSAIVPGDAIKAALTLASKKEAIKFYCRADLTTIVGDNWEIVTRNIDGVYPDYGRVLEHREKWYSGIDSAKWLKTLKELKPFVDKECGMVIMETEGGALYFSVQGGVRVFVERTNLGFEKIAFDINYLIDAITHHTVQCAVIDERLAFVGDDFIVMGMRV